jgi:flagellar basal-body rod protein FlgC
MSFFNALNISASGLTAQRFRMDTISQNVANVNTTRTENGTAYRRKGVLFEAKNQPHTFSEYFDVSLHKYNVGGGVRVRKVFDDISEGPLVYEPSHPDADANGYVRMPNVNVVEEMVNLISASRSFEANVTAMNTTKSMITRIVEMGRS